ncbi:MAG: DUF4294 domain-containing protein [Flavobacteriales bacterium]|nr:DUF4294 domain-containing protein [Flavobacteriales bacterium]
MLLPRANILIGLALLAMQARGQVALDGTVHKAIVIDGDTLPVIDLWPSEVVSRWTARDRRQAERFDRLTRRVVKVYPFARITSELLREYEHDLAAIDRNGDQDLYVKLAEAELRAEFEAEVRDMTTSEGRVLTKLIDRETGKTSYELVRQLRGSFTAFIWQGMARVFGQDLKSTYDAAGDDQLMELVVQRIERGELTVAQRPARTAQAQARLERRKARLYRRYGLSASSAED